jgi:hypothetical protein
VEFARVMDFYLSLYTQFRLSQRQIALYQQIAGDARRRSAPLVLMVPPMSPYELELIRQTGHWDEFRAWKRALLSTGPFWDFSLYGLLDSSGRLFRDVEHFTPHFGDMMLRRMLGSDFPGCSNAESIGDSVPVWIDSTSLDRAQALQEQMLARIRVEVPRYASAVAAKLSESKAAGSRAP